MDIKQLVYIVESLIFASDSPLSVRQISTIVQEADKEEIEQAIALLEEDLDNRAFFLNKVGGGYQFATKPEFSKWISHMHESKARNRLSRASLETLSIIAFKQPISRIEVSAIRGVNSDGVIKNLLERQLITITGRDKEQGRALLFSTTKEFLQYFNLNDIADLPRPKEIEELLAEGEGGKLLNDLPEEVFEEEAQEENAENSKNENEQNKDVSSESAADASVENTEKPADDSAPQQEQNEGADNGKDVNGSEPIENKNTVEQSVESDDASK